MRDFPVFTTENGAASLILREIPYSGAAYIRIQATASPEALLEDCAGFCKAAGAERVYAAGHASLKRYPVFTVIRRMKWNKRSVQTDAVLLPATSETLEVWREICNEKMTDVPTAAYMTRAAAERLLEENKTYFVYRDETCIGICAGTEDTVKVIAALRPGSGWDVLAALCNALPEETVYLDVAEDNVKAVRLYERFGFEKTEETVCWHKVI